MKTTHISISEAKRRFGELVKRSAYGEEKFVLEFRGKPIAVLTSVEDGDTRGERTLRALDSLKRLRESTRAYSSVNFDTTEEIRKLREGRAKEFDDLPG